MRHNKHVTATRPLQRNFAAAFRITPNAGCVPETGAARDRTGQDRTGQDRAGQGGTGRMGRHGKFGEGSDKKAAGRATGTAQEQPGQPGQPGQQKEQRQKQRRGKTGTAAEATAGRTEEGKLQRKIRSSTYNPEAAFAKFFNNAATVKSQLKLQNPVTIKQRNKPLNARLSALRRHKEKKPPD